MGNTSQGKQNNAFDAKSSDPKNERGSVFTSERGSVLTSERGSTFHSEQGSTILEYVLGIALLFPVALGIGLSLEKISQSRGKIALQASQYLLPCTSANPNLGTVDPEECK